MPERSLYFDSIAGDRAYDALDRARVYGSLAGDGFVPGHGDEAQVAPTTVESMDVRMLVGRHWVQGHLHEVHTSPIAKTVTTAHATLDRIDTAVVRVDPASAVRAVLFDVVPGTAAVTPAAPPLDQVVEDRWEHPVADIHLPAGATQIFASEAEAPAGQGWIVPRDVPAETVPAPTQLEQTFRFQPGSNADASSSSYATWAGVSQSVTFPSWATQALVTVHVMGAFAVTDTSNHALAPAIGTSQPPGRRVRKPSSSTETFDLTVSEVVTLPTPGGTHTVALKAIRVSGTGALRATDETVFRMTVTPMR